MAFLQLSELEWHEGETAMHQMMHNPPLDNPTVPALTPQLANHLRVAPLVAIGLLDKHDRPWTTLWGGESALGGAIAQGIIGIRATVTPKHDPVVEELFGQAANEEVIRAEGKGRMISGVTMDLEARKRVKLFGHMMAAAVSRKEDEVTGTSEWTLEAQLVLKIEQSLGNCPKYLNKKHIITGVSKPTLLSDTTQLPPEAVSLLQKADLFFISSCQKDQDMDTNHRGGPPGFIRMVMNDRDGAVLCWPEYSGNRLYQTLGNLKTNPVGGICVPDFESGDMLYMTGTTEILVGHSAAEVLPRTNLAVKFTVSAARMVQQALPFRGIPGEHSPYNPPVRYLPSEKRPARVGTKSSRAVLVSQTKLTPSISRYRFALDEPAAYKAGQYVTLDLSSQLDMGYSHMRDDDPGSLNDDFVRTFTVSSAPHSHSQLSPNEFEITVRHIGAATRYISRFEGSHASNRAQLEVAVKGFGGDFRVVHSTADDKILFIAAGIGITPLLPSLHELDLSRLRLLWTMRQDDLPLAEETIKQHPTLAKATTLFVTGNSPPPASVTQAVAETHHRRLTLDDVHAEDDERVFVCTAPSLRKQIADWLPGRELIFEDFNF